MAQGYPQPVVLDATVLSNFASTDGIALLAAVLESPVVVPAVRDEIERGLRAGYEYLDAAVDSFDEELAVRAVDRDAQFPAIRERLDHGEADSLLGVIEFGGTLATDDLAARRVAHSRDLPVTGSLGLLALGIERGCIDTETADEWLDTWRERRGYYSPVESVDEILEGGE